MKTTPEPPLEISPYDSARVIRTVHELLEVSRSDRLFDRLADIFVPGQALGCWLENSDWPEPRRSESRTPEWVWELAAKGGDRLLRFPFRFGNGKTGAFVLIGERPYLKGESREVFEVGVCGALALGRLFALEEAEDALNQKDRMLRVVTRELKAPLTTIQVGMDLLKPKNARGNLLATDLQARMERSVKRMRGLVGGLLEASRFSSGRSATLTRRPISPRELVEEVAAFYRALFHEKGIDFRQEWQGSFPDLEVDTEGVFQIFSNLIGNAIQSSPRGGVIWLRARVEGPSCRFMIEDEGPGIPPQELENVFESLWQADRESGDYPGGMGLFIVRSVVEAHGGRSWAANRKEGSGAVFSFTLPIRPEGDKLDPHRRAGSHD